ncbi:MAG TPA: hypothetical protein VHC41_04060 [Mycobacteriales bacterium]|nr:hypothetical protein [Mycobacteriales bacterium]
MGWTWRLESASGDTVTADGLGAGESFPTQSDAETWVGEQWRELLAQGVTAVYLYEDDREVYGPMSLLPAD